MKLSTPIVITPRLMPGLRVNDTFISVEFRRIGKWGRRTYFVAVDSPGFSYESEELSNTVRDKGPGHQAALSDILCFLDASACDDEPQFPPEVVAWVKENRHSIECLQLELETPGLIED